MSDNLNVGFPEPEIFGADKEPNETRQESELILGKFKNQDELIKAYRESERFISKTREELKNAQSRPEASASDIPRDAYEFYNEINEFLTENNAAQSPEQVFEYLRQNPELLALDNKSALSFALRNSQPDKKDDFAENVANYLNILPPELISGQGSELFTTPQKEPKTFEEAGDLFLNMIRK